jgi:hypothetical protein
VEVDGRLALFAGAGWDALVAARYAAAGARRLPGWAMAVARSVPDLWRRPLVEVRADGWLVTAGRSSSSSSAPRRSTDAGCRSTPARDRTPDAPGSASIRARSHRFLLEAGRWVVRLSPRARPVDASTVEIRSLDERGLPLQADGDAVGGRQRWSFAIRPQAVRLIGRWG